jgi:hypothetical protein
VQILIWAVAYRLLTPVQPIDTLESAVYFSAVTFTTLGYGDITLSSEQWRLLTGIEALNGVLLLGWSTALLYAVVHRTWSGYAEHHLRHAGAVRRPGPAERQGSPIPRTPVAASASNLSSTSRQPAASAEQSMTTARTKSPSGSLPILQGVLPIKASQVPAEVIAGLTLAALAIPEVMGYTKIAGTPVVTGLYTMLIPAVLFAFFGSSRHLVVGADSATAAILAAGLVGLAAVG